MVKKSFFCISLFLFANSEIKDLYGELYEGKNLNNGRLKSFLLSSVKKTILKEEISEKEQEIEDLKMAKNLASRKNSKKRLSEQEEESERIDSENKDPIDLREAFTGWISQVGKSALNYGKKIILEEKNNDCVKEQIGQEVKAALQIEDQKQKEDTQESVDLLPEQSESIQQAKDKNASSWWWPFGKSDRNQEDNIEERIAQGQFKPEATQEKTPVQIEKSKQGVKTASQIEDQKQKADTQKSVDLLPEQSESIQQAKDKNASSWWWPFGKSDRNQEDNIEERIAQGQFKPEATQEKTPVQIEKSKQGVKTASQIEDQKQKADTQKSVDLLPEQSESIQQAKDKNASSWWWPFGNSDRNREDNIEERIAQGQFKAEATQKKPSVQTQETNKQKVENVQKNTEILPEQSRSIQQEGNTQDRIKQEQFKIDASRVMQFFNEVEIIAAQEKHCMQKKQDQQKIEVALSIKEQKQTDFLLEQPKLIPKENDVEETFAQGQFTQENLQQTTQDYSLENEVDTDHTKVFNAVSNKKEEFLKIFSVSFDKQKLMYFGISAVALVTICGVTYVLYKNGTFKKIGEYIQGHKMGISTATLAVIVLMLVGAYTKQKHITLQEINNLVIAQYKKIDHIFEFYRYI